MGQVHYQLRTTAVRLWMLMPTYPREAEQHRSVADAVVFGDAAGLLREHIPGFEKQFVRAFGHRPPEEEMG